MTREENRRSSERSGERRREARGSGEKRSEAAGCRNKAPGRGSHVFPGPGPRWGGPAASWSFSSQLLSVFLSPAPTSNSWFEICPMGHSACIICGCCFIESALRGPLCHSGRTMLSRNYKKWLGHRCPMERRSTPD